MLPERRTCSQLFPAGTWPKFLLLSANWPAPGSVAAGHAAAGMIQRSLLPRLQSPPYIQSAS
jgi:hypothetical protein